MCTNMGTSMDAIFPGRSGRGFHVRIARAAVYLLAAICLAGCDYLPFGFTKIGEITAKAPQFEGREVKVRGKVSDVSKIPLLNIKSYALQDDTGTITVITTGTLPVMGQKMGLRGVVESMLIVGGQSYGLTLKEIARLPTL